MEVTGIVQIAKKSRKRGSSQGGIVPMGEILLKRRVVICGTDLNGANGCGCKWATLEKMEEILEPGNIPPSSGSEDQEQEGR
jgi:hypothetical protein